MAKVVVYGASDDLVEVDGDVSVEFSPRDENCSLMFGDGTVLDVRYMLGVWRVTQRTAGHAVFSKVEAPPADEANYSDRVTLEGDLRWLVVAEDIEFSRIVSS